MYFFSTSFWIFIDYTSKVKQSEDVLCSALRLSGRILSALDSEAENVPWLQFGETVKRFSSTEQTFFLRFSVATTLQVGSFLNNMFSPLISRKCRNKMVDKYIIYWSIHFYILDKKYMYKNIFCRFYFFIGKPSFANADTKK